ncbi:MAG: hypothetical protein ACF8XB_20125 [Planctomycetota bacterium JB042]
MIGGALRLAWRSIAHYRVRSLLLVLAFGLVFLLPLAVDRLVERLGDALGDRAAATPLVLGARGSRFDLVLAALTFRGRVPRPLPLAEAEALRATGRADAVPLVLGSSVGGAPLVGTSPDYLERRGLRVARGAPFVWLGEAVCGSAAAAALGVDAGGTALTDRGSLYDLASAAPLRLRIRGVLAETGTADDHAVFCGLETAWVAAGLAHGHVEAGEVDEDRRLSAAEEEGVVVLDASVAEATEITPENRASFHVHGDPSRRPVTAVLVWPDDAKARTILRGRYRVHDTVQLLVARDVADELLGYVVRAKRFFDANAALVAAGTGLLLALVVLLTIRARRRELDTLAKIGCGRGTIAATIGLEFGIVCLGGFALALAGAAAVSALLAAGWGGA